MHDDKTETPREDKTNRPSHAERPNGLNTSPADDKHDTPTPAATTIHTNASDDNDDKGNASLSGPSNHTMPAPSSEDATPPSAEPDRDDSPTPTAPDSPAGQEQTAPPTQSEPAAEDEASEHTDESDTQLPQELAQDLQVEVHFEIGRIVLPLQALANLRPDQILDTLNGFEFPKIKAVSAGRAFAEGELVRLDERIGLRITKIYP